MEWMPVAAELEVSSRPLAVTVAGVPLMVLRPAADADPVVFADRCPHRLVPLSAAGYADTQPMILALFRRRKGTRRPRPA